MSGPRDQVLRHARIGFRVAALAIWSYAAVVLYQTISQRQHYEDIFFGVLAIAVFIALLGFTAYRGSAVSIAVVALMAGYSWAHNYPLFSWPEWLFAGIATFAVLYGFIGALVYRWAIKREAA